MSLAYINTKGVCGGMIGEGKVQQIGHLVLAIVNSFLEEVSYGPHSY